MDIFCWDVLIRKYLLHHKMNATMLWLKSLYILSNRQFYICLNEHLAYTCIHMLVWLFGICGCGFFCFASIYTSMSIRHFVLYSC